MKDDHHRHNSPWWWLTAVRLISPSYTMYADWQNKIKWIIIRFSSITLTLVTVFLKLVSPAIHEKEDSCLTADHSRTACDWPVWSLVCWAQTVVPDMELGHSSRLPTNVSVLFIRSPSSVSQRWNSKISSVGRREKWRKYKIPWGRYRWVREGCGWRCYHWSNLEIRLINAHRSVLLLGVYKSLTPFPSKAATERHISEHTSCFF